jgi:hypothetical protein
MMGEQIDAYPLCWPINRKRTLHYNREAARFKVTFARSRDNIVREVELLAGRWPDPRVIISTNIALRRDGLPLAGQRQPDDVGVAVYFEYKGKQRCFACDRWKNIEDNMQAICKTIEALRGIARWGTGDMLDAAFTGFTALPAPASKDWRDVLGLTSNVALDTARAAYRRLALEFHPDRNPHGAARMAEINAAWDQAQKELAP